MTSPAESTLRYWLDVESLSAPGAEKSDEEGEHFYVRYVHRASPFPWGQSWRLDGRRRRHIVRFGIIPVASYDAELLAVLKTEKAGDDDSGRRSDSPFTFLGLFEADDAGCPLPGTLKLADFAETFARLLRADRPLSDYRGRLTARFETFAADGLAGAGSTCVTDAFLAALVSEATSALGWTPQGMDEAPVAIVRCEAAVTQKGRPRTVRPAPIGSFHVDALSAALAAVSHGEAATGLVLPYLAEPVPGDRVDCMDLSVIDRTLSLDAMPDGCWPSAHDLTLMQQVAVNQALRSCADGGIFSINGPPGTGKTTLLMDVVAAMVVERAKILAGFDVPDDAFEKRWTVQFPNRVPANVHALDRRLHGFGIVVASSNNGAVENITRELPSVGKIDRKHRGDAAHFAATAQALLNLKPQDPDDEEEDDDEGGERAPVKPKKPAPAWGLISAALGKKRNRDSFIGTLRAKKDNGWEPHSIRRQIEEAAGTIDWRRARTDFTEALDEVARLKREIADREAMEAALEAARKAEAGARRRAEAAAGALAEAERQEAAAAAASAERQKDFRRADEGTRLLLAGRPNGLCRWLAGFPGIMAPMRRTREWFRRFDDALSRRAAREADMEKAAGAARDAAGATATARTERQAAGSALRRLAGERESLETRCKALEERQPDLLTFGSFKAMDPDARQQALPRSSAALKEARARLFLKAMALHHAFVVEAERPFQQNLMRALDMLGGKSAVDRVLPDAADHLWATLFLLVPVLSSTFAAFSSCFRTMTPGSIGWLIVDEAGQAVPQHAIGALHKAKRALVVGDPYQVEPVITLDPNVDAKLQERRRAPSRLRSTMVSMQVVADRINGFGTHMRNYEGEPDWVGSPLKVHRRCVEPMFSISNRIAYNGSMVLGRGKREGEIKTAARRPLLGESRWIDVEGAEANRKHFIPAQADIVCGIVRAFVAQGWLKEDGDDGLPDLYIISPFKSAADHMRARLRTECRLWAPGVKESTVGRWLRKSVGTVHTFQGKEAETVLLLLGGATDGAIEWAAKTPNILNVAATRSQRRLYVVGDWNRWMRWPLASVMGQPEHLKRVPAAETAMLLNSLGGGTAPAARHTEVTASA